MATEFHGIITKREDVGRPSGRDCAAKHDRRSRHCAGGKSRRCVWGQRTKIKIQ